MRKIILIFFLSFILIFAVSAEAQRRNVTPQHWVPLIKQEQEPATPTQGLAIIYADPNGDGVYKNFEGEKTYFAGTNATYNTFTNLIDANTLAIDETNRSVGINQTTPDANAYLHISDKYIVCKIFTSAGINACIDALGSEGGEVYLPEGTYSITTEVSIDYDNTTIRGAGESTILQMDTNAGWGINNEKDYVTFKDFVVDCNGKDWQSFYASVRMYNATGSKMENVTFKNINSRALYAGCDETVNDKSFLIIDSCCFLGNDASGSLGLCTITGDAGAKITISNCHFQDLAKAILAEDSLLLINNCSFESCPGFNIYAYESAANSSQYSVVSNCYFSNGTVYEDIYIKSSYWIISNNIFRNSSSISISSAGDYHIISDNIFITPTDHIFGIIYINGDYWIVTDNAFYLEANDADYCIQFDNGDNCAVGSNIFDTDVDTAAIYMDADDTGNIFYGNQNTSFSGSNRVYGDFKVYSNFVHAGIDEDTIANDPNNSPAAHTLIPTATYVSLTCQNPNTCDIVMSETGAEQGQICIITNLSSYACDFADTAGVSELAGAFAMEQYDILELIYLSDRWVERCRSDNSP